MGWLRNALTLVMKAMQHKAEKTEGHRLEAALVVLQHLSRTSPSRDLVDCVARVALAICRGGGDHMGGVDTVHADFLRLVRIAVAR